MSTRLSRVATATPLSIGTGCTIAMAAASTMTEAVKGLSRERIAALFDAFHGLVTGKDVAPLDARLAAFAGVAAFPMRVKCATLAWHALRAALEGAGAPVSTE